MRFSYNLSLKPINWGVIQYDSRLAILSNATLAGKSTGSKSARSCLATYHPTCLTMQKDQKLIMLGYKPIQTPCSLVVWRKTSQKPLKNTKKKPKTSKKRFKNIEKPSKNHPKTLQNRQFWSYKHHHQAGVHWRLRLPWEALGHAARGRFHGEAAAARPSRPILAWHTWELSESKNNEINK